jgi:hypothetical protein
MNPRTPGADWRVSKCMRQAKLTAIKNHVVAANIGC